MVRGVNHPASVIAVSATVYSCERSVDEIVRPV